MEGAGLFLISFMLMGIGLSIDGLAKAIREWTAVYSSTPKEE